MTDNNTTVTIELDRVRELRFSHRAMKRWSAHTGKSIAELDTSVLSPAEVEVLLYFMLEKDAEDHGETLELAQMEALLDMVPLGVVYGKLSDAMAAAFPEQAVGAPPKNAKRAAGTGKNA